MCFDGGGAAKSSRLAPAHRSCEHVFVTSGATILHADLDAFYASVEQRDRPRLRGRPVIVGGGVVLAASYEAKACGVRTAMGGAQARRLCPHAVVVEPRMGAYAEASRAVFEVFGDTSPLVEGLSIDEAFIDVGGLRRVSGTPREIAVVLRRRVLERVGLPITVGVARTKFLAKVASGVAKPDGLLVVPPDGRAGVPPPAAGRAAVGRRPGDGGQAARPGHRHGRRRGRAAGGGAGGDAGGGVGASPARTGAQPRPAAGRGGAPAPVHRVPAGARAVAPAARARRRRRGGAGRPGDAAHARRPAGGAHGHAAAAVRRLHPGVAVAHAGRRRRPTRRRSWPPCGGCCGGRRR